LEEYQKDLSKKKACYDQLELNINEMLLNEKRKIELSEIENNDRKVE